MEPQWPLPEPQPSGKQNMGSKIAIGIGASLLVWFLIDEILSVVNIWVFAAILAVCLVLALRRGGQQRSQQLQIVLLLAAAVLGWVLLAFLFSLFSFWVIIAATAVLGSVVYVKDRRIKQSQRWVEQGCCANCGYDLRATPDRCPECGRESSRDEPTWRKLRREWGNIKPADQLEQPSPAPPPQPMPVISIPTVLKTPDFHEGPIPLEGDNEQ